jgi:hypothetical protein
VPAGLRGYHDPVTQELPEQPRPDELEEPEMDPSRPTEDSDELAEGAQEEVAEQQTQKGV